RRRRRMPHCRRARGRRDRHAAARPRRRPRRVAPGLNATCARPLPSRRRGKPYRTAFKKAWLTPAGSLGADVEQRVRRIATQGWLVPCLRIEARREASSALGAQGMALQKLGAVGGSFLLEPSKEVRGGFGRNIGAPQHCDRIAVGLSLILAR